MMGPFLARFWIRIVLLLGCTYCTFFVQIGSRTLWQHAQRIADTSEARELGNEIVAVLGSAKSAVARRLGNQIGNPDTP
jgi:hypothetical protein